MWMFCISIHSLRVEGDPDVLMGCCVEGISIHSLRVEGDLQFINVDWSENHFNPLPPCGGRPGTPAFAFWRAAISIHSLRVEGDKGTLDKITDVS